MLVPYQDLEMVCIPILALLTQSKKHFGQPNKLNIALGTALIAAAELKVDATPIEGFNAATIDAVLDLKEKGLHSTVILALGYRDSEKDYMAATKKVRLPIDEMITKVY